MTKLEELKDLIDSVETSRFKIVLQAQLAAGALSDMRSFVFGATLFCPIENADRITIIQLLATLK